MGGTPYPGLVGGVPHPADQEGTPFPGLDGGGVPYPADLVGTPFPGLYRGGVGYPIQLMGGTPSPQQGVPPSPAGGTPSPAPPWQSSIGCTCYAAGGVPLAFTQEDFLVCRYDLFCDLADNIVSASEAIRQVLGMPDRTVDEGREDPSEYNVILRSIYAKQKMNMDMKVFGPGFTKFERTGKYY